VPVLDIVANLDTYVSEKYPNNNYGSSVELRATDYPTSGFGDHHSMMRFPLSGIPAGSTINSATLTIYVTKDYYGHTAMRRLTNESWGESTTWNQWHDHYNYAQAMTNDVNGTGAKTLTVTADGLSNIASKIGGNLHWGQGSMGADSRDLKYNSRNHGTAVRRPTLHVNYTLPPPTISSLAEDGLIYPESSDKRTVTATGTNFVGTQDWFRFVKDGEPNTGKVYDASSKGTTNSTSCWGKPPVDIMPGKYKVSVQYDGGSVTSTATADVKYHPD